MEMLGSIIHSIKKTGITDNKLWICVNELNKCRLKREWRRCVKPRYTSPCTIIIVVHFVYCAGGVTHVT
jgi:hypothetical protein